MCHNRTRAPQQMDLQRRGGATRAHREPASRQLFNLAWITTVRGSAADRVDRLDADRQVDVGAIEVERIGSQAAPVRGRPATLHRNHPRR